MGASLVSRCGALLLPFSSLSELPIIRLLDPSLRRRALHAQYSFLPFGAGPHALRARALTHDSCAPARTGLHRRMLPLVGPSFVRPRLLRQLGRPFLCPATVATATAVKGISVVCIGGYGRVRQLSPSSA